MKRPLLCLFVVAISGLLTSQALAQPDFTGGAKPTDTKSTDVKPSDAKPSDAKPAEPKLETLSQELAALKKQMEDSAALLKRLTEQLEKNGELGSQIQNVAASLKKLTDRLDKMEVDLARLENEPNSRRAYSQNPPATTAAKGSIKLENRYPQQMTVIVDGTPYVLQSGEVRFVEKVPGNFTYEVVGVQPSVTRTVAAGETFGVKVYPR